MVKSSNCSYRIVMLRLLVQISEVFRYDSDNRGVWIIGVQIMEVGLGNTSTTLNEF